MEQSDMTERDIDVLIEREIELSEQDAEKPAISLRHFPEGEDDQFTVTWYCRALRLSKDFDVADRFMNLWTSLNSAIRIDRENFTDRALLEAMCGDSFWKNIYESAKSDEFTKQLEVLQEFHTITNMKSKREIPINTDTLENIIDAIYEIRCNLFHGRKDPEDRSGRDYGLISAAFPILLALVTQYMLRKEYFTTSRHRYRIEELMNGYDLVSLP